MRDTREILGFDTTELGTIRITDAQEKFATCEIIEGGEGVKRGDVVRLEPEKK